MLSAIISFLTTSLRGWKACRPRYFLRRALKPMGRQSWKEKVESCWCMSTAKMACVSSTLVRLTPCEWKRTSVSQRESWKILVMVLDSKISLRPHSKNSCLLLAERKSKRKTVLRVGEAICNSVSSPVRPSETPSQSTARIDSLANDEQMEEHDFLDPTMKTEKETRPQVTRRVFACLLEVLL